MAKEMRFNAVLNDQVSKGLVEVTKKLEAFNAGIANMGRKQSEEAKKQGERQAGEAKQASEKLIAEIDRRERQRIALQRASIALEERMEKQRAAAMELNSRQTLQATQSRAAASARIERQAAIAEASLVLDKFDRRIAIERVKHAQILADLKGNDAAIEAEVRRHNAVVGRIQMDKANFPNTPFQQMLGSFTKLNGALGKIVPTLSTASNELQGMSGAAGTAGVAMAGLGGAITSLTMGPIGAAVFGITMLSTGLNLLIQDAEKAASLKAGLGSDIKDPEKLKAIIAAMEKFEAAKGKRGNAAGLASNEVAKLTGRTGQEMEDVGFSAAVLRRQQVALAKVTEYRRVHNEDAKKLDEDLSQARSALIQNDTARALALEDFRHKAQTKALGAHKENLLKAEELHALNVRKIRQDAATQELQDQASAAIEAFKKSEEIQFRIAKAARKERDEAIAADEKRTEQIYKSRDRLAQAKGEAAGPLEEMKAKQAAELEEYAGNQAAITNLKQAHEIERTRIEKEEGDKRTRLQEENAAAVGRAMRGNLEGVARQFKAFAPIYKAFAQFENAVATRAAAIEAYKAGSAIPIIGPVAGPAAAAAAVAYGLANAANINAQKFATGTDYAPGGMALVGEQGPEMVYLPKGSQVKTAPETRQMMSPRIHAPITIQLSGSATQADADRISDTLEQRLYALAADLDEIEYRNIPRSHR